MIISVFSVLRTSLMENLLKSGSWFLFWPQLVRCQLIIRWFKLDITILDQLIAINKFGPHLTSCLLLPDPNCSLNGLGPPCFKIQLDSFKMVAGLLLIRDVPPFWPSQRIQFKLDFTSEFGSKEKLQHTGVRTTTCPAKWWSRVHSGLHNPLLQFVC